MMRTYYRIKCYLFRYAEGVGGEVKNGKVGTETEKSKSLDSEVGEGEAVLVTVESTEEMDELPLNGESIEAMEEWLRKN